MNSIILQPVSNTVTNLGLVMTLECEGNDPDCTYQWQSRTQQGQFSDIQLTYVVSNTRFLTWVPDTYNIIFRCKITFPDNEVLYTNESTISVGLPPNYGLYNDWYYSEHIYGLQNADDRWHNIKKVMDKMCITWQWTEVCAACFAGNMWVESGASPGMWEVWPSGGEENTVRGYGLVQWTPARTSLIPWATQTFPGQQWRNNGDIQLARIKYEWDNNFQWVGYGGWRNVHWDLPLEEMMTNVCYGYLRGTPEQFESTWANRLRACFTVMNRYKKLPIYVILKKMTDQGRKNR